MKREGKRIEFETREDLPPTAMSLAGTDWNRTGSWKYLEPYYQDITPPCANRCLAGNDVVAMMRAVEEERWEDAVRAMIKVNPFPSMTGRVCPHPCEQPCNRKAYGGPVSIRSIERQVGDYKLREGIVPELPEAKHPKVHIVGSGPAGLAAAVTLRRLGHPVTVHEKAEEPGGLLRGGIPAYRLPLDVIRDEVKWLGKLGVEFETGKAIGPKEIEGFGPTILAFGFSRSRNLRIPGEDLPGVYDGLPLLALIRDGKQPDIGKRVAVVGGGNTAMDVARSLLRVGCDSAIYYRRSKREMPAFKEEIKQGEEEGIPIHLLTTPVKVEEGPNGALNLVLIKMELGEPDDSGRARPVPIEGSEYVVEVDAVVKALGETLEEEVLPEGVKAKWSTVETNEQWLTDRPGVYACGDIAGRFGNTVAEAIRSGRLCAHALHHDVTEEDVPPVDFRESVGSEVAKFKNLNMAYFEKEGSRKPSILEPGARRDNFDEVERDFTDEDARAEAARCFKCGTCVECDTCLYFCPDMAITRRTEGGYDLHLEYCKGCGVCVEECPRQAIHLRRST